MRTLVGLALVATLLLSGCSSSTDSSGSSSSGATTGHGTSSGATSGHTTGPSGTGGATSSATSAGSGGGSNHAPTGSLSASTAAGSLNVTFTISGADPDHDPVSWTLDANGDGKVDRNQTAPATLPAKVTFTYAAPGNYTAKLTLSDGKSTTSYPTPVNVTGAAGGAVGQSATASWQGGAYGCPGPNDPVLVGKPTAGILYGEIAIDLGTIGQSYKADFGAFKSTDLFTAMDFYDGSGARIDGGGAAFGDPNVITGTVPAGAAYAQFENCGASGGSVTYTTM